jgi:hypothetical protein
MRLIRNNIAGQPRDPDRQKVLDPAQAKWPSQAPGSSHVQDRPLAPAFVAIRHIRAELLIQAKADPVQLGGVIAVGQLVHRLPDLVQMVAERSCQVSLHRHRVGWLLTIRRAQLSVCGRQ